MSQRLLGAAALCCMLVLSACGGGAAPAGGGANAPFRVLAVLGLTGINQASANVSLQALRASADRLNASGGIAGRHIEVVTADSQGDPTNAVTALQDAISSAEPEFVFASNASNETLAMLPVLTRQKLFSMASSQVKTADDPARFPYHFGMTPSSAAQVSALPAKLTADRITKLAVLLSQDAFGDGALGGVQSVIPAGAETTVVRYNPADLDLTVPWQKAADGNPGAIYSDCFGDPCPRLFAGRAKAGVTNIPAIFGSGPATTSTGPAGFAKPDALVNLTTLMWEFNIRKPESERSADYNAFYSAMTAGSPPQNSLLAAFFAWDTLKVVKAGVEKAGSSDAQAVANALTSTAIPAGTLLTTSAALSYSDKTHFPPAPTTVVQYLPPGPLHNGLFDLAGAP